MYSYSSYCPPGQCEDTCCSHTFCFPCCTTCYKGCPQHNPYVPYCPTGWCVYRCCDPDGTNCRPCCSPVCPQYHNGYWYAPGPGPIPIPTPPPYCPPPNCIGYGGCHGSGESVCVDFDSGKKKYVKCQNGTWIPTGIEC